MSEEKSTEEKVDPHLEASNRFYSAVITYSRGLLKEHLDGLVKMSEISNYYICTLEKHKAGTLHANVIVKYEGDADNLKTRNMWLRRKVRKYVYKVKKDVTLSPYALKVQCLKTTLTNAMGYIIKDDPHLGNPHVLKGFTSNWCIEQYEKWFSKRHKWGTVKNIKVCDAPNCIIEYSKKYSMSLAGREDFGLVLKKMCLEGINVLPWERQMKGIIAIVNLKLGSEREFDAWLYNCGYSL